MRMVYGLSFRSSYLNILHKKKKQNKTKQKQKQTNEQTNTKTKQMTPHHNEFCDTTGLSESVQACNTLLVEWMIANDCKI